MSFFNEHTSLESLADKYSSLTRMLYVLSLLAVVVISFSGLFGSYRVGFEDFFQFVLVLVIGYLVVTYVFGLNAILIEIHENIKKISEK